MRFLTYVDKLKELDVTNIEPMTQVLFITPADGDGASRAHAELREDVLAPVRCGEGNFVSGPGSRQDPFSAFPR